MATFTLDILDKNANVLHSGNYAQSSHDKEIKNYLRDRANSLLRNSKSLGEHKPQPAAFKIREIR